MRELLVRGVSWEEASRVAGILTREGFVSRAALACIPPDDFSTEYLTRIQICGLGLQNMLWEIRLPVALMALAVGVVGMLLGLAALQRPSGSIDGIPAAFAPYGQPQLSMAPISSGNLDSIDVVRGAGSVRYGPQNVGGVINFVLKRDPTGIDVSAEFHAQGVNIRHIGLMRSMLWRDLPGNDFVHLSFAVLRC